MSDSSKLLILLLIILLQSLYLGLGARPVYKIQEARIAETAREMSVSGDWIVPRLNGEIRLQKPPLPYWLGALSYRLSEKIDEFSLRFPFACFAAFTAILLFYWMHAMVGLNTAFAVSLCFVTNYIALRYFRSGEADAVLLFFVTAACLLAYQIVYQAPTFKNVLLFHLSMGLGFLTKGPAGIFIPLATLVVAAVMNRRPTVLKRCLHPAGILVLLIVGFGWYALILYQYPDLGSHFFGKQLDDTFISGTHARPFYWYVPHLFDYFAPWSLFIIPAAVWLYKSRPLHPVVQYSLIWFAVTFLALSFTVNKQTQYALLLNAPLAMLLGSYLSMASGKFVRFNHWVLILVLLAMTIGLAIILNKIHAPLAASIPWLVGLALIPAAMARILKVKNGVAFHWVLLAGLSSAAYLLSESYLFEAPPKAATKQFLQQAAKYTPLYQYGKSDGAVSFYTNRVVKQVTSDEEIFGLLNVNSEIYLLVQDVQPTWNDKLDGRKLMAQEDVSLWKLTWARSVSYHR